MSWENCRAVPSQQLPHVCVELAFKGLASAGKGLLYTGFPRSLTDGYAILMSPSKGETAVPGCHCPCGMAVRMREVMARPWVGVSVLLALLVITLPRACRGRTAVRFPANSSHLCRAGLVLTDCFVLISKRFLRCGFSPFINQRLCRAGGSQSGQNSCLWLPLPAWYGCAHTWGTDPAVGWCMCNPCFKFALFSMQ